MPVEIRQITIKAEVNPNDSQSVGNGNNAPVSGGSVEEIAQRAAEKVLEMLKDMQER